MKIIIACLVVCFLGQTLASPAPSYLHNLMKLFGGGRSTFQQDDNNADTARFHWYRQNAEQQEKDRVAGELESLVTSEGKESSDDDNDLALMQSFITALAAIEEDKAKVMAEDGDNIKMQSLRGLQKSLLRAGKRYLTNKYCTSKESVAKA